MLMWFELIVKYRCQELEHLEGFHTRFLFRGLRPLICERLKRMQSYHRTEEFVWFLE